jgi:acetylglutamate kinase
VHGGGKLASELANKLNIPVLIHEGKRITDKETLDIATMVYAGLLNKTIVAQLQSLLCNAIGLCGADANCIKANKRPVVEIDYGFVGDLNAGSINIEFLIALIQHEITPIFSAITHDGKGNLLNTNADTIASSLSVALSHIYDVQLVYCFEKNGVLTDMNDQQSLIPKINMEQYQQLKEQGIIHSGMIPKLDNAFKALDQGVSSIHIGKSDHLLELLKTQEHAGTILYN